MSKSLDAAIAYYSLGWMPIPLTQGSKNPNRKGWQKERWARDELPNCFNNGQNIGLLLGEPSGGLIDVDLDCPEAVSIADQILPATGMISGRPSSPLSHRWYICSPLVATTKFRDPSLAEIDSRSMLVELRSTGGQTVVPPSIHPTGEAYYWHGELAPVKVNGKELGKAVRNLGACSLVARHWKNGQRQDTSLALSGALLRAGWPHSSVEKFIRLAATAANDEELEDRIKTVETTEQKILAGEKATGFPSLADLLGEKVAGCLQKWLALSLIVNERASEPKSEIDLVRVRCLADVKPEKVDFLWHPYIPKGKLTLIEGDPGVGKSWLTCAIAAATAAGTGPAGWNINEPSNVLMLSVEDGLADTIRPRFDTMQADVKRIFAIEGALVFNDLGFFFLEEKIVEYGPALVVIDPLVAYIGAGVDLHKANETRAVMAKLALIAEKYHCAIIAVRHLTKGGKDKPIYRGIGSIDFTAACRSVLLVGNDPDDIHRRAMVHIKHNLTEPGGAVGYEINDGSFLWTGASNLTAGRILASSSDDEKTSALRAAEDFLREVLSEGPRAAKDIKREAREAGITDITLSRAKQSLGVKARKEGRPGETGQRWICELPQAHEDYHEGSQKESNDNLRPSNNGKGVNFQNLAEDYQSSARDNLQAENDYLRGSSTLVDCNICGGQGSRLTDCQRCGEFLL